MKCTNWRLWVMPPRPGKLYIQRPLLHGSDCALLLHDNAACCPCCSFVLWHERARRNKVLPLHGKAFAPRERWRSSFSSFVLGDL